jgi:hypothetical protein
MTERVRWPERPVAEVEWQYNQAVNETNIACTHAPLSWWEPYQHLLPYLHPGEIPWQAEEARRLYAEHGPEKFAGLNLFGLIEGKEVETCPAH